MTCCSQCNKHWSKLNIRREIERIDYATGTKFTIKNVCFRCAEDIYKRNQVWYSLNIYFTVSPDKLQKLRELHAIDQSCI